MCIETINGFMRFIILRPLPPSYSSYYYDYLYNYKSLPSLVFICSLATFYI